MGGAASAAEGRPFTPHCPCRYAPDKQWQLDTVLDVLISVGVGASGALCSLQRPPLPSPPLHQAGSFVRDDLVAGIVRLISSSPELQGCAAQHLYCAVVKDDGQQPLVQVGDREG